MVQGVDPGDRSKRRGCSRRLIVQGMPPKPNSPRDLEKPTSPSQDGVREPPGPGEENKEEKFPRKGDLIDPTSPDQDPK